MNNATDVQIAVLKLKENLDKALFEAGGTVLSTTALSTMTALELLLMLAPNGIHFYFEVK